MSYVDFAQFQYHSVSRSDYNRLVHSFIILHLSVISKVLEFYQARILFFDGSLLSSAYIVADLY